MLTPTATVPGGGAAAMMSASSSSSAASTTDPGILDDHELEFGLHATAEDPGGEEHHLADVPSGYMGAFEGPEKTLEVCFTPGIGDPRGCRALDRRTLDAILAEARCEILSKTSNAYLDAYVLSESSLFVYPHKVVIKTCGRTTLLRCLRRLVEVATSDSFDDVVGEGRRASDDDGQNNPVVADKTTNLGLRLEWVGYSRKNYCYPDEQPSPHTSFGEELAYLKAHSHDAELLKGGKAARSAAFDGHGYVLGPITGDHWFVYVSDQCERPAFTATERTINVMMFDLDDAVRDAFYLQGSRERRDLAHAAREMTRRSGLGALVHAEGASSASSASASQTTKTPLVDAHAFAPCGYSMNALAFESYTTVHVTPEKECSYASFETNTALKSYGSLVKNVLAVFKPKRVVITLFADEAGLSQLPRSATFDGLPRLDVANVGRYQRSDYSSLHVECDCVCLMANYVLCDDGSVPNNSRLAAKYKLDKLHQNLPGPQLHVGSLP